MFALGWHDAKCKTIISNRGSNIRGNDAIRERHRIISVQGLERTEVVSKIVQRPQLIEMLFDCFSCIDIHDHLRQGSLKMEETWKTKTWWHRIFATIFGIIVTDCYFAHKYMMNRSHQVPQTFIDFVDMLAYQMISNTYLQRARRARMEENDDQEDQFVHQLAPLRQLPCYRAVAQDPKKRAKRRCKVCGAKTAFYCVQCSNLRNETSPDVIPLCSITLNTCFLQYNHNSV